MALVSLPPLSLPARAVERVKRPPADQIWERAHAEPFIITGTLDDWPLSLRLRACKSDEEALVEMGKLMQGQEVEYSVHAARTKGLFHFEDDLETPNYSPELTGTWENFVETLRESLSGRSADYVYMQGHYVDRETELFRTLGKNVVYFLERDDQVIPFLWLGSGGHTLPLHYDASHTVICMLWGRKRITLFPPDQLHNMYHAPLDRLLAGAPTSHVRLGSLDYDRYPRFRDAAKTALVATIGPGDVLFLPPFWWHNVESFGLNIMINDRVFESVKRPEMALIEENLSEAIRLFAEAGDAQCTEGRAYYDALVFQGRKEVPIPTALAALKTGFGSTVTSNAAELRDVMARWPSEVRSHMQRMYDTFAFRAFGEPFPSQPGAHLAMLQRNAERKSFFYRGI